MSRTVSVFVPCYNYGHFLEECVRSVLAQRGVDVDVLILDDASPDQTPDVAARLAAADPRVRHVRHEVNRGHIATYNHGLELVTGDYTVLISADDVMARGALARAVDVMEADPSVAFVYGRARFFTGQCPAQPEDDAPYDVVRVDGEDWIERVCKVGENFMVSPEVVVRTRCQREVGGYDPGLPHSGDLEMWLRLAQVGAVGQVLGVEQAFTRKHGASMRHTTFADPVASLRQRRAAFEAALARMPATRQTSLRRSVDQALARDALWSIAQMLYRRQVDREAAARTWAYAVETGVVPATPGEVRARDLLQLWAPFVDGLRRWPRGWVKARRRQLENRRSRQRFPANDGSTRRPSLPA